MDRESGVVVEASDRPITRNNTQEVKTLLLSVLIPVYNEEETVDVVISKVKSVQLPSTVKKEIIIVNDGSTDRTKDKLNAYEGQDGITIIHCTQNKGKTNALRVGIENATGDLLIVQDADLEYDPDLFPQLLKPVLDGEADIVYGSRFLGTIKAMTLLNYIGNRLSNITFNLFYPAKLTDINTCYKIIKKEVMDKIEITSNGFAFETELSAKLVQSGYTIKEVPIPYVARSRQAGKKMNWACAWEMYWGIFKYRK